MLDLLIYIYIYILALYIYEKSNTPFSYMLCLFCKKPIGELNLERAFDEDSGVFCMLYTYA